MLNSQTYVVGNKYSKNETNLHILQSLFESLNHTHTHTRQAQHDTPVVLLQPVQLYFVLCTQSHLPVPYARRNKREILA